MIKVIKLIKSIIIIFIMKNFNFLINNKIKQNYYLLLQF